jgi:carbon-monoxide dehydrogenase medium subunit
MKPPTFDYVRAESIEEAVAALAGSDGDGKVLAGGQSLVPLLSMRLARPSVLVDLNRLRSLDYVCREGDVLRIGALTRHQTVLCSPVARQCVPLMPEALRHVGHVTIRNRGTIGGSVAHADPAAELPSVIRALDAELVVQGHAGTRMVSAAEFFHGYLTTALAADEVLTEIRVPVQSPNSRVAVHQLSRRHGDFALVGVFVALELLGDHCASARIAVAGTNSEPLRATAAENLLTGASLTPALLADAAAAVAAATAPVDDIHASAAYRRRMAQVMARRALQSIAGPARGGAAA